MSVSRTHLFSPSLWLRERLFRIYVYYAEMYQMWINNNPFPVKLEFIAREFQYCAHTQLLCTTINNNLTNLKQPLPTNLLDTAMTIADRRADKTTDRVRPEQERKLTRLRRNKDKNDRKVGQEYFFPSLRQNRDSYCHTD